MKLFSFGGQKSVNVYLKGENAAQSDDDSFTEGSTSTRGGSASGGLVSDTSHGAINCCPVFTSADLHCLCLMNVEVVECMCCDMS